MIYKATLSYASASNRANQQANKVSKLKAFFETGSKSGINPDHAPKLKRQLTRLDIAKNVADVNLPGWRLHPLLAIYRSVFDSR